MFIQERSIAAYNKHQINTCSNRHQFFSFFSIFSVEKIQKSMYKQYQVIVYNAFARSTSIQYRKRLLFGCHDKKESNNCPITSIKMTCKYHIWLVNDHDRLKIYKDIVYRTMSGSLLYIKFAELIWYKNL